MIGETFRPGPEDTENFAKREEIIEKQKNLMPQGYEAILENDLMPGTTISIAKRDFGDSGKIAEGMEEKITVVDKSQLKVKDITQDSDIIAYKNETGKILYGSKRELLRGAWVKKPMEEAEKYQKAA